MMMVDGEDKKNVRILVVVITNDGLLCNVDAVFGIIFLFDFLMCFVRMKVGML